MNTINNEQGATWLREQLTVPEDTPVPMVATYIGIFQNSASAVNTINTPLGTRYSTKHLSEWKQGTRDIPRRVEKVMQSYVLYYLFSPLCAKKLCKLLNL